MWDDPAVSRVISALQFQSGGGSQSDSEQTQSVSQSNLHGVSDFRGEIPLGNDEKGIKEAV